MTIKVFEAFAGYGSQSLALQRLAIEHKVVAISEIDKYAIQAYYALHDKNIPNLGDISKIKVEDIPEHDLFTYSFPCQDISVAGNMKGIVKGETRSGLLYECEKIIEAKRPKYLLMENVKNLVSKKFRPQFYEWLRYLKSLGYTNYAQVLNAKDYGVPQNRERVFVISILGEHEKYEFPKPIPLDKCIRDILENEVDEKYYIKAKTSQELICKVKDKMLTNIECCDSTVMNPKILNIANCITAHYNAGITHRPSVGVGVIEKTEITQDGKILPLYRVRRLTPRECFRLMGLTENNIDIIQSTGISDTQQYKMAGNSIVVDVLQAIFKNLFMED